MQNRAKVLDEIHEWVQDPHMRSFQRDRRIVAITELLEHGAPTDRDKAHVGTHMGILRNWHLNLGTVRIADGDPAGWTDLSLGMWAEYCHIRLIFEQWEKDTRRNKQARMEIRGPSLCLAMAIALRENEIADWLGQRFATSRDHGGFGRWGLCRLPWLLLELHRRRTGTEPMSSHAHAVLPAPYRELFEGWSDDAAFAQALQAACEFHCEQDEDVGDELIGEFAHGPFDIIPFEILATRDVRQREGLGFPEIDHPLLAPPFGEIPSKIPPVEDPLLSRVKRLFVV